METKIANESWIEIIIIRVNLFILNRIRNVMKIWRSTSKFSADFQGEYLGMRVLNTIKQINR